jgi:hypothetical protein
MTIWVLTEEYNDYDQHGEYFVYAWDHKPSREELRLRGVETGRPYAADYLTFVLAGGGRIRVASYYEEQWYFLRELEATGETK